MMRKTLFLAVSLLLINFNVNAVNTDPILKQKATKKAAKAKTNRKNLTKPRHIKKNRRLKKQRAIITSPDPH